MTPTKPKTLEDFPKFHVTAVRDKAPYKDGFHIFEVEGRYDPALAPALDRISSDESAKWFWLVYGSRGCICATLESFDKETRTAIVSCYETEMPNVLGLKLAYLSPFWQGYHIGMVLDPNWGWERKQYQGTDAVAEDYEAEDVSIVNGREVKVWTKLEPVGESRGQSRHYPAEDQTLPVKPGARLIPGGWGHEHCDLCHEHIDPGDFGYRDPDESWLCEKCYERYAARHDLAFVDEL